ncbi:TolC family protein [Formosa haliotis]|uniref:TolC family protein n=1 Tax=Formosa haliotis TaxID=1555194 RepID=UPI0008261B9B|nr:TolC family protein [Formosa haliotis]
MKSRFLILSALCLFSLQFCLAQETQLLSIPEAVHLALENSDGAKIINSQVTTSEHEVQVAKALQYPDFTVGGQYRHLTRIDFASEINMDPSTEIEATEGVSIPNVNQLMMGNLDISMPIFSGFKIKNTIEASKNLHTASTYKAKNNNEKLALQTINLYINLYKAEQSIHLFEDNLISAKQRVTDFTNMEENGILARNDLLKAQLQESQVSISLENAKKTKNILNYRLVTLLKLPEQTIVETISDNFGMAPTSVETDSIYRSDLEALKYQELATENQIKIAKGNYYPSIGLVGGYMAVDIPNAFTLTNAMNIGVGVTYNLSDIFKNKSEVEVAKSKADELKYTIDKATDDIKIEIENASQEYQLAYKKLALYAKSEEQAIENYRIVKDKFDNGLADTNDTLEADLEQLQAKINLAFAKADISQKYYELLTAQGQLTSLINN